MSLKIAVYLTVDPWCPAEGIAGIGFQAVCHSDKEYTELASALMVLQLSTNRLIFPLL